MSVDARSRTTNHELPTTSPGVQKLDAVRDKLGYLKQLCTAKSEAARDYAEAIEAVATAAKIDKGALSSFVAAATGDNVERKRDRARQLALLFDEIAA